MSTAWWHRHQPFNATYSCGSPMWKARQALHWNVVTTRRACALVAWEVELGDRAATLLGC